MIIEFKANNFHHIKARFVTEEGPDEGKILVTVTDSRLNYNYQNRHCLMTYNNVIDFVKENDHPYVINQLNTNFMNVL